MEFVCSELAIVRVVFFTVLFFEHVLRKRIRLSHTVGFIECLEIVTKFIIGTYRLFRERVILSIRAREFHIIKRYCV